MFFLLKIKKDFIETKTIKTTFNFDKTTMLVS